MDSNLKGSDLIGSGKLDWNKNIGGDQSELGSGGAGKVGSADFTTSNQSIDIKPNAVGTNLDNAKTTKKQDKREDDF
ncbi:hypothetical protein ABK040_016459 [Willaertia magna]